MSLVEEFNNIDVRDYEARHPALFAYVKEQMAQPGKQFLLMGDTNHDDGVVREFISGPGMAALFRKADIKHVNLEFYRELAPPETTAAYKVKMNDPEAADKAYWTSFTNNLKKEWVKRILGTASEDEISMHTKPIWRSRSFGYMQAGLNVINAASLQWDDEVIEGVTLAERVFLGDRETAAYIKNCVNDQKAAVIYGAGHFQYEDTLASHLDKKRCVHVDVYRNRQNYIHLLRAGLSYADLLPDRVFLIEENILESPDPGLYKIAKDKMDDRFQRRKEGIARLYGSHANPGEKAAAIARIAKIPGIDSQYFNYIPATPG